MTEDLRSEERSGNTSLKVTTGRSNVLFPTLAVDRDRNGRLSYDELQRHGRNRLRDSHSGSGTGEEEQGQEDGHDFKTPGWWAGSGMTLQIQVVLLLNA